MILNSNISLKQKIVLYTSRVVPVLSITDLQAARMTNDHKVQDVIVTRKNQPEAWYAQQSKLGYHRGWIG